MDYTLMHKRIRVAEMELDEASGFIRKIRALYEPAHLPLGVLVRGGAADRGALNEWWADRAVPASRAGVREALEKLGAADPGTLLTRCLGRNLSDQYWICPAGSDLTWDDVNFFEHGFSADIGDVLFGADIEADGPDFSSPDGATDGNLKKRWEIQNGRRCLVKGGSRPYCQQPFNEVIAWGIMERLGVPCVPHTVTWIGKEPYSVCGDFVTGDTELIPAWRIFLTQKRKSSVSVYQHFVNCCEALGIKDAVPFLDRMITVDYLIANEDRHMNNFGVLRNAETLEWLGFAPMYDSGSSLGYDKMPGQMSLDRGVVCKPFKNHHAEQIKLVSDFSWLHLDALNDVEELIAGTLSADGAEKYIEENRIRAIGRAVRQRIGNLGRFAAGCASARMITTEDDVERDIAEDYTQKQ